MCTEEPMNATQNATSSDGKGSLDRVILSVYFTSSVCTFVECLFAVYISIRNVRLRNKPSKFFSWSLVLSVGVLSGLSLVYGAILLFHPGAHYVTVYGCFIRVIQRCLSTVSCLTLACLALDRYVSICWPLRYFSLMTEARCAALSVLCWVSGFVLPIMPCAAKLHSFCSDGKSNIVFLTSYTVVYNMGAFGMLVFYVMVSREFRRRPSTAKCENDQLTETEALVRMKTAKSAIKVLLLYSLLSLPHIIIPLCMRVFCWKVHPVVYNGSHLLHRFHLLLFLPMYVWANADSHEALTNSFRRMCMRMNAFLHRIFNGCLSIFFVLYAFIFSPSEDDDRRYSLEEELSQISVISADNSGDNKG